MDLKELVSVTENMTDDCQRALLEALREILYRQKGPAKLKQSHDLDCIVQFGLLDFDGDRYAIPLQAKKRIRKLYTYLLRKYDVTLIVDGDGSTSEIPKGSEFVYTIFANGEGKLTLQFPDDEVTELLNLFGVNPCDNWQTK